MNYVGMALNLAVVRQLGGKDVRFNVNINNPL
jgi:hypothetical protein